MEIRERLAYGWIVFSFLFYFVMFLTNLAKAI